MSIAASQAARFYEQVVTEGRVFTVTDEEGHLVFPTADGDAVPFWSSRSRVVRVQKMHPKYAKWQISEEPLDEFLSRTLPLLEEGGVCVGVNWAGKRLVGYNLSAPDLRRNLEYWIDRGQGGVA